jgi:Tfp pilus assembly protein FimT
MGPVYVTPRATSKSRRGFTVIELLLVLTISIALLSVALPNMSDELRQHRLLAEQQALIELGRHGRQLALGSPGHWVLCIAEKELGSCISRGSAGQQWLLFDDHNQDGVRQSTEPLAQRLELTTDSQTLYASGRSSLRFAVGARVVDSGSVLLCDRRLAQGLRVIFFQSGRIRPSLDANQDGLEDRNRSSLSCS